MASSRSRQENENRSSNIPSEPYHSAHAQPPDIVASLLALDRKTFVALIKIAALTPPRVELLGRLFLAVRNRQLVEPNRAGHELLRGRASIKLKL